MSNGIPGLVAITDPDGFDHARRNLDRLHGELGGALAAGHGELDTVTGSPGTGQDAVSASYTQALASAADAVASVKAQVTNSHGSLRTVIDRLERWNGDVTRIQQDTAERIHRTGAV